MDRNFVRSSNGTIDIVALRKESVDRNAGILPHDGRKIIVALRKESVDRNSLSV